MASHAASGVHPPPAGGGSSQPTPCGAGGKSLSRYGSARAHFCSSESCVWVQRCHRCPWAGLWPWAEELAWVGELGMWGLVAVAGPGESS